MEGAVTFRSAGAQEADCRLNVEIGFDGRRCFDDEDELTVIGEWFMLEDGLDIMK